METPDQVLARCFDKAVKRFNIERLAKALYQEYKYEKH